MFLDGTPQIYFDQLNFIHQHLQKISPNLESKDHVVNHVAFKLRRRDLVQSYNYQNGKNGNLPNGFS